MTQNKDIGGFHVAPIGMRHINKTDSIVDSVIDKFIERANMGKEKYGTDLDRTDLELIDFINNVILICLSQSWVKRQT